MIADKPNGGKGGGRNPSRHQNPERNFVRFTYGNKALFLPLGDGPAKITDGYGGWVEVSRPKDVPITRWEAGVALRMEVPILLDGWARHVGVERNLAKLLELGRRSDGDREPQKFRLKGAVPFGGSKRKWVLETTPDFDNEIWSSDGRLLRQGLMLPLMEFEPGDRVKFTRKPKKLPSSYTTKKGDTLRKIAKDLLPDGTIKEIGDYARAIGKANKIRDIRRELDKGIELKLPKLPKS